MRVVIIWTAGSELERQLSVVKKEGVDGRFRGHDGELKTED